MNVELKQATQKLVSKATPEELEQITRKVFGKNIKNPRAQQVYVADQIAKIDPADAQLGEIFNKIAAIV